MRTKPDVDIGTGRVQTPTGIRTLLGDLTPDELERVAIAVIREHRSRLQRAQDLFDEVARLEAAGSGDEELQQVNHDYRIATLNLYAQHQLVSMVVERLGYVPEVDGQRPILN